MRVAVLGTRGFPGVQGGVETHCENLYPRLATKGCEVTVLARKPYVGNKELEHKGVRIVPISCPKNKFLEAIIHTYHGALAAKQLKPDILHIHAIGPSLLVPFAKRKGIKVVMTHHGPDYKRKKWNWFARLILKIGERNGCRNADAIICISESVAEDLRKRYKRDITYIPNGITIPEIAQNDEALKKYGLEKGKYILAVGRFVPEKGFHDLIEAFGKIGTDPSNEESDALGQSRFSWKLVIAGDADHEDKYSLSLKEKAKANPNIVLTGFISGEPLSELYSHAGLFVLPSYYEGLPIALLEAMSYGLSCIVSDIPANREVGLRNDRYFEPGNINQLKLKMVEFLNKPLGKSEKETQIAVISEKYNWNKIAEMTLGVYEKCYGCK